MKRPFVKKTLVALSVALVAGCAAPAPQDDAPADIAAVNAVREAFAKAYNAGDAQAIANLYTADAVSQPNHQATLTGRDAILASQKTVFEQVNVKVVLTPDETRTMGNRAFDRGKYTAEVTPKAGGPTVTSEGRYLVLLVKEADGTWRVNHDIDNTATPMAAAALGDGGGAGK